MRTLEIGGNQIEYQEYGTGQPMLFIHGAFSSGNTWRKVIPELSKCYRCIVPEWPFGGHKTPIQAPMDFSPRGIADLIKKTLQALNLETVILVANDTGGAYAQVFTATHGELVSHLILTNCEGFEIFPPKKFQSLQTMVKVPGYLWLLGKFFRYKPALKLSITFGLLSNKLSKEDLYQYYVKHFAENALIRADFKKLAIEWDPKYTEEAAKKLTNFNKPVLLIWGKDDTELFPVTLGKRINAIFQNSTFVEVEDAMTYVQEDQPSKFVAHVQQFIG